MFQLSVGSRPTKSLFSSTHLTTSLSFLFSLVNTRRIRQLGGFFKFSEFELLEAASSSRRLKGVEHDSESYDHYTLLAVASFMFGL